MALPSSQVDASSGDETDSTSDDDDDGVVVYRQAKLVPRATSRVLFASKRAPHASRALQSGPPIVAIPESPVSDAQSDRPNNTVPLAPSPNNSMAWSELTATSEARHAERAPLSLGGVADADDMKAKFPELFALLPPITELADFNLTSVFTTEDFKVLLGIRRNLALRELAAMLMGRLGVQPSPGSLALPSHTSAQRGRNSMDSAGDGSSANSSSRTATPKWSRPRMPRPSSPSTPLPRRASRRGSTTLAQRDAAARKDLASAFNRTKKKEASVGTLFDTCQVGEIACTAIEVPVQHRLALVEKCSDAVLGNLVRRNPGWSGELRRLNFGSQQIFLLAEGEAKSTVVFSRHRDSQAIVIHLFGTAGPCRRQGYGTVLLQMLQKFADGVRVFAEVGTSKIPSWWLSKAFLGTPFRFSKPRLWTSTALLCWNVDSEKLCTTYQQGQAVHRCPFQNCSFVSHRTSKVEDHVQSSHTAESARSCSAHQPWQEPESFKCYCNAAVVSTADTSAVKQPRTNSDSVQKFSARQRRERKKHDEQERKWVRKIIAFAKQTDKSGLAAKAKTLFRLMKADLCNSPSSYDEEEDDFDESSDESENRCICTACGREFSSKSGLGNHRRHCTAQGMENESSDSSSDEHDDPEFQHAAIRVGPEFQCTGIRSFQAVGMPSEVDCPADSRAGQVVWDPTKILAPKLQSYLTMLRNLDAKDAEDEYMIDPWPREAAGPKPLAPVHDMDPCANLKRGLIPCDHPSIKPSPRHGDPLKMDTGLRHLAECDYDIERALLGLNGVIEKETLESDHTNLIVKGIKTHGKDFAAVCSMVNEAAEADAVRAGSRYRPMTISYVTEFYYSKWRHTNAHEEWRRSAQYQQNKQVRRRQKTIFQQHTRVVRSKNQNIKGKRKRTRENVSDCESSRESVSLRESVSAPNAEAAAAAKKAKVAEQAFAGSPAVQPAAVRPSQVETACRRYGQRNKDMPDVPVPNPEVAGVAKKEKTTAEWTFAARLAAADTATVRVEGSVDVIFEGQGPMGIRWHSTSTSSSIHNNSTANGDMIYIAEIAPTCLHKTKLEVGMLLTKIQGRSILDSKFEEVIQVLNVVPRPLTLTFYGVDGSASNS